MKAVPDFPSDIDRSVTKEQARQVFKKFREKRDEITREILENISKEVDKDKYIV